MEKKTKKQPQQNFLTAHNNLIIRSHKRARNKSMIIRKKKVGKSIVRVLLYIYEYIGI